MCNMTSIVNDTNLPKCFINKIVSPTNDDGITVVRSGIQSMADIARWIKEFGQNTNTHWIISKSVSEGQRIVCSKQYVCQYSSSRKIKDKNRSIAKDSLCQAQINFQIKLNTSYTRASDIHIREGLCGVIIIKSKHSHPIEPDDSLRVAAFNSPLKDTFFEYFNAGMGVAESLKCYQRDMEVSDNNNKAENASSGKSTPTERTVRYWYDKWKKLENLKRRTEIAVSKASTSRGFQTSPFIQPALRNPHIFYQPQHRNRRATIQAELLRSSYHPQTIVDNHRDNVRLLISPTSDDDRPTSARARSPSIFQDINPKANLSPPAMLDNCDAASITSQNARNDEPVAFGEYVGLSLCRMDEYVRTIVVHKISNIIFEADTGKYDKEEKEAKVEENASVVVPVTSTST